MSSLKLEVMTPEKVAVDSQVLSVYLQGSQGRFGILPQHTALISQLDFGVMELETKAGKQHLLCGKGLVEVSNNKVTVLVRSAEQSDDVDVARAKAALTRAKSRRDSNDRDVDMMRTELALYRAIQRLNFTGKL